MKRLLGNGILLAATLVAGTARGAVINDGTLTNNLARLANAETGGAETVVQVADGGFLVAAEQDLQGMPLFPMRTVWYAHNFVATSGVYTVSADFKPAASEIQCRGGVMGWVNTATNHGIAFQVVPGGDTPPPSFRVAFVDFLATDAPENENLSHLYNLDGTPATATPGSAWSDLGTDYVAANFATFELKFSAPTNADWAVLTNATAHVTARVWQGEGTNRVQVSQTIELLTDLPVPDADHHRFGYFGVWASIILEGSTIGYFDNLAAEGNLQQVNVPPGVRLTSPLDGAVFTAPATVTLTAEASDFDGTVAEVGFFAGTNLLGTLTNQPFTLVWTNVPANTNQYELTAVATDNQNATTISLPVRITVTNALTVNIVSPTNGAVFIAPATIGLRAEMSDTNAAITRVDFYFAGTNLIDSATSSPFTVTWTNVSSGPYELTAVAVDDLGASLVSNPVSITVKASGVAPTLFWTIEGGTLVLTWSSPGYQLQVSTNVALPSAWEKVREDTSNSTVYRVPLLSAQPLFYRLVQVSIPSTVSLTIQWSGNQVVISWPPGVTGYQLQAKDDLNSTTWSDIPTTGNEYRESAAAAKRFFRLAQSSGPGSVALTIRWSANQVLLSWPAQATGYRLQAKDDLNATIWTNVQTTGNEYRESGATGKRFFRLVQ